MEAVEPPLELVHRGRIGDANVSVRAERLARHHGHVRLREQFFGKLQRALNAALFECRADVRISVKRSLGFCAFYSWNGSQALNHEVAALSVLGEHDLDRGLRPAQSLHSRFL